MNIVVICACLLATATATANNSTNNVTEKLVAEETKVSTNSTKEILKASETSDPAKVEIVKQIKRLNPDGSYTIGYEADDGTFKIESRDVRGNVKGTFGYIDRDGEIKRVTYSSSSDSTPTAVPVSTSSTSTSTTPMPMMIIRVNKTVSTTRRPLGTVVYPTRTSSTTKSVHSAVIQPIPRTRRPGTRVTTNTFDTTTEKQRLEQSTSNILNLYKPKSEEVVELKRTKQVSPDDLITKQTTTDRSTKPQTLKPVYENVDEKSSEVKANTIRRELTGTSSNPYMIHLRQSTGGDSTDVYGGHLSMGTVRPLFTTTTPRPRLVPIHSIVAAREKLQQQLHNYNPDEQETTIEASTGRVFEHENTVTSNPVPEVQIPLHRNQIDERQYQQHLYRRPSAAVLFRTNEYLKDNPGAPIPIGNQRPFLQYDFQQNKVFDPQYVKDTVQTRGSVNEPVVAQQYNQQQFAPQAYELAPVTRIIQIPVDERGVPILNYQAKFVNPYRPQTQQPAPPIAYQPRYVEPIDNMHAITTPVSTRDLKRLLHILILRQNRLQALMEQLMNSGNFQPLPMIRQQQFEYRRPQYHNMVPRYIDDEQYDQDSQNDVYYDQYNGHYESQRFVPRRKLYTRPIYDTDGSSSNRVEEMPEYLPADIREALLLKMLVLAISPEFTPTPAPPPPPTELTTAAPSRKQVRNIQILGEEGSMDEMKRPHRS